MKKTAYHETWEHGFVRVDGKGRKVYVIREEVGGEKYWRSTRAHTLGGAEAEYEEFSKNRAGYVPGKAVAVPSREGAVELTRVLADEFLAWSRDTKENSKGHVANQRIAMDFWMKHLARKDLRAVSLELDIQQPLKGQPQQANRRRTLRTFYSWLRSEEGGNRIKLAEDPTFKSLKVPKTDPKKRRKPNKAVSWEALLEVQRALDKKAQAPERTSRGTFDAGNREAPWGAIFRVQMASGWHNTELKRFATDGSIEAYRGPQKRAVAVLVTVHKSGQEHRTAVDDDTMKAARLVREYGSFEPANYSTKVREISVELGIMEFGAGQLRHSVATHMVDEGASIYEVATFLGHRSMETTRRFYATHALPWNPMLRGVGGDGPSASPS